MKIYIIIYKQGQMISLVKSIKKKPDGDHRARVTIRENLENAKVYMNKKAASKMVAILNKQWGVERFSVEEIDAEFK